LRDFFVEDEHYVGFSTHQEAIEKILYYVNNPWEARRIAEAGHEAVRGHTYTNRLKQVFETAGLI
jgi:spore maturation protein CgeB